MANELQTTQSVVDAIVQYHNNNNMKSSKPEPEQKEEEEEEDSSVQGMCATVLPIPISLLPTGCVAALVPRCGLKKSRRAGEVARPQLWALELEERVPVGDGRYLVLIDPLPGSDDGCAMLADVEVVTRQSGRVLLVDLDKGKTGSQAMGCCQRPVAEELKNKVLFLRALDPTFQRSSVLWEQVANNMVITQWGDCPRVLMTNEPQGNHSAAVVLEDNCQDPDGQHPLFVVPADDDRMNPQEQEAEKATAENLESNNVPTILSGDDVPDNTTVGLLLDVFAPLTGTFASVKMAGAENRAKVVASMCQFGRLEEFSGTHRHRTYLDFQHFRFLLDILGIEEQVMKQHAAAAYVHDHDLGRPITAKLPSTTDGDDDGVCGVRRLIKLYFKDRKTRKSGRRNHYFSLLVLHVVALCKEMHQSSLAKARSVAYILTSCTWASDPNLRELCRKLVKDMLVDDDVKK